MTELQWNEDPHDPSLTPHPDSVMAGLKGHVDTTTTSGKTSGVQQEQLMVLRQFDGGGITVPPPFEGPVKNGS